MRDAFAMLNSIIPHNRSDILNPYQRYFLKTNATERHIVKTYVNAFITHLMMIIIIRLTNEFNVVYTPTHNLLLV